MTSLVVLVGWQRGSRVCFSTPFFLLLIPYHPGGTGACWEGRLVLTPETMAQPWLRQLLSFFCRVCSCGLLHSQPISTEDPVYAHLSPSLLVSCSKQYYRYQQSSSVLKPNTFPQNIRTILGNGNKSVLTQLTHLASLLQLVSKLQNQAFWWPSGSEYLRVYPEPTRIMSHFLSEH